MKIFLSEQATADLHSAYRYVAEHDEKAAEALIQNLDEKLQHLTRFPFLGRERNSLSPSLRGLVVGEQIIFYIIKDEAITVIRVIHTHMDIDVEFQR